MTAVGTFAPRVGAADGSAGRAAAGTADAIVVLSAGGVCAVVDARDGALPRLVHWGPELGAVDADLVAALVLGAQRLPAPNDVDEPARVAILPEHWTGWTGRPGLQGSRAGRAWSTRFRTTGIVVDGVPVVGVRLHSSGSMVVTAQDTEAGLALVLTIELSPAGLLRARASLTNSGAEPYTVDALTLAFPVPAEAAELLDFAGRWGRERSPQRSRFGAGLHLRENRRGRSGADSAFVLHAGTPGFGFGHGEIHAVHTAFSGNHVHYAERTFTGHRLLGGGELLLSGEVRLGPEESYTSPWLYGSYGVGLDEVAARFHSRLRDRTPAVSADRPVTLNVWEAVTFDHRLDRLLDLAERAAAVGVERFVLDDGWFGSRRNDRAGLGDWVVSPDAWPQGLHPLVDRVVGLGMQFGLWFEPEMVNADSDVARAHPEWIMAAREEWPVTARHQQVLNLAVPGAYAHVRDQLLAVLAEYPISYVKWDHNRDLVEAGDRTDGGRPAVNAQTAATYRMLDEIRSAHPGLEIESCSSGGGRIDLEILGRTDRVWGSDVIDPLERQSIDRWTVQLIPPEYLGSHIASPRSHTTGRTHDLAFRAGTAVFAHLGIEWDLTSASRDELDELSAWIGFYRRHRRLLLGGTVIRIDTADENLSVHGVVAADRSSALFAMGVLGSLDAVPGPALRLRGLDPDRSYLVRPVVVGRPPAGLQLPHWCGAVESDHAGVRTHRGIVLSGGALGQVGVAAPIVDPEQLLLLRLDSVTDRSPGVAADP